ncbi:MAG: hypothetical protein ABEJ31_14320 [Haloarculaceae archaeon]
MVRSRTVTAVAGLVASIIVSALLWRYFHTFVFFLFVPFVPVLFRRAGSADRPPVRECPTCGFRTRADEYEFCPRDGTRLE